MSAPSSSSIERRPSAEARAGEGKVPGLRRGRSEPRSSADDSAGSGKPEGGVASAFSRVGVARATERADREAAERGAVSEGDDDDGEGRLLLLMERSGVVSVDADDAELDAINAERLLLRAAAIFLSGLCLVRENFLRV